MLGGRVKTLHPDVHGGILARSIPSDEHDLASQGISPISIVLCNLYLFSSTIAQPNCTLANPVEEIDIGGITLLRAAAKNHARVSVDSDPSDYTEFLEAWKATSGDVGHNLRSKLALKAFEMTAEYEDVISGYFREQYAFADLPNDRLAGPSNGSHSATAQILTKSPLRHMLPRANSPSKLPVALRVTSTYLTPSTPTRLLVSSRRLRRVIQTRLACWSRRRHRTRRDIEKGLWGGRLEGIAYSSRLRVPKGTRSRPHVVLWRLYRTVRPLRSGHSKDHFSGGFRRKIVFFNYVPDAVERKQVRGSSRVFTARVLLAERQTSGGCGTTLVC
ncbi:methylglyoxal synthase-like domain-containing protein [Mycena amicta]|nr:methylglyoxal synthase-like domain-containing protein [Mycena amicta]